MSTPTSATPSAAITDALRADLDRVAPGLGERAVQFVTTGTPEAVRLEIGNHQQAGAQTA
jgi:hypothetical protein